MGLFNSPKRSPQPPKEEPAAAPAPATPLTREDVQAMIEGVNQNTVNQLTSVVSQLREGIESLASRQPVVIDRPVATQLETPITDDDIDNAVASGQGASKVVRGLLERTAREVEGRLSGRIGQLEQFGAAAIGNLNVERLTQREHYKRFKKEIDTKVSALPAEYKANQATLDLIYNSVVGEHAEELAREAREQAIRQANEEPVRAVNEIDVRSNGGGSKPGSGAIRGTDRPSVPTVEEFGGAGALVSLQQKDARSGKDGDSFAQSMGYRDWAHMIQQYEQLKAENGDA